MSRAMARPRPVPPSSWLRASSSRRNGLNTSSRIVGRNAGPVVVDRHGQPAVVAVAGDRDRRRVARGVRHEIGEAALERGRPHRDDRLAVERRRWSCGRCARRRPSARRGTPPCRSAPAARRHRRARRRDRPRACGAISSTSFFIASTSGAVAEQRQLQLEAGQDGAQVVRRRRPASRCAARSRARCGVFISMKACAARRTSRAPRGRKFGTSRPLPKLSAASASRRIGRIWLRRNRIATVEQHQRGADHPEQEDFRVRRIGRRCAARTPASPCRRAGCGSRPAPSGRPCRSRTAGRSACAISSDSAWSSSEKNGFGPGGGMSATGRKSTTRPSRSCAMRRICAWSASCG